MKPLYTERRLLRAAEKLVTHIEGIVNRWAAATFNPLYHLGALSIFLLIVLTLTGLYLTILYRPNAFDAYSSVAGISADWFGSLVRSVHRYAADALVVTIILHALKMLVGDRFWGSRWLAWVSGIVLAGIIWLIGAMGYWLVWDQRAQWLTEYSAGLLGGAVQLAFATPAALTRAYTFFIIILFLHIFLSVAILGGLFIHMLRLQRARIWSPRWLMFAASIALIAVALIKPADSAAPADLLQLPANLSINWWYLGFLPLIQSWGSIPVWLISILVVGGLLALPWLARGRHLGPAVVSDAQCTGCAICAQECPYGAIEMQTRTDGGRFETLAVINPNLCTGCGICVGTCATVGVDLANLPARTIREQLVDAVAAEQREDRQPLVIFACQRHTTLGTLPAAAHDLQSIAAALAKSGAEQPEPLPSYTVRHAQIDPQSKTTTPAVIVPIPCVGMVQPEWAREALAVGSAGVMVLGCPAHDCSFREGPRWVNLRLDKRRKLTHQGVHLIELTPGHAHALRSHPPLTPAPQAEAADTGGRSLSPVRQAVGIIAGFLLLFLITLNSVLVDYPVTVTTPNQAVLRLALEHTGTLRTPLNLDGGTAQGPIDPASAQALSGERLPVRVRMEIEGVTTFEREYTPGGIRRDGAMFGLEQWTLAPGRYRVQLWIMDDGATWRSGYDGAIDLGGRQVRILSYNPTTRLFEVR